MRIVICVDIDDRTDDRIQNRAECYRRLYRFITEAIDSADDIEWESSDEWFDADGYMLSDDEAYTARMAADVFNPYSCNAGD